MRQNNNQRRGRSRNNQNRRPSRNQSFDSNGPSVRLRGTAAQLNEKYQAMARDAMSAGDRVMVENYHQHADHYYRVMISLNPLAQRDEDGQPEMGDMDDMQPHEGRGRGDRSQSPDGQSQAGQIQGGQNQERQNQERQNQGGQNQGGQNQGGQNQGGQNQGGQNQERRDNRNRRGRDRQEEGEEPPVAQGEGDAADRNTGAEAELRGRSRRQPVRRQDSDPRRRSGGRADEAKPGDEPLDQGLHRILGGAPEKTREDGEAGDSTGDPTGDAVASEAADSAAVVSDGTGGDKVAGDGSGPDAAVEAAAPAEKAPKPRARRRKPAAEAEDAAPAEPVADAAV